MRQQQFSTVRQMAAPVQFISPAAVPRTPVTKESCLFEMQSFDDCVATEGLDCSPKDLWIQIPFFCGQHAECW